MSVQHDVIVKTYKGSQNQATRLFREDAEEMAEKGYFPTSQTYAPGSYSTGAFLFALLLCFIVIGVLILVYMMIVKPAGVLSVTYEFRGTAASRAQDEKTCPKCAERIKAAAQVCRFCGYQFDATTIVAREAAAVAVQKPTLARQLGKLVGRLRSKN